MSQQIELYIREKVKELRRDGAIIGISGGVDSAVVLGLTVRGLGKEKVFGLIMPERDSSPLTIKHAKLVAKKFDVSLDKEMKKGRNGSQVSLFPTGTALLTLCLYFPFSRHKFGLSVNILKFPKKF